MISPGLWIKEIKEFKTVLYLGGGLLTVTAVLLPPTFHLVTGWLYQSVEGIPVYLSMTEVKTLPATFDFYAWSMWVTRILLVASLLVAFFLGVVTLAGEIKRGTAVFLSSQPFTARDIVTTKFFGGASLLALIIITATLFFSISALLSGYSFAVSPVWLSSMVVLFGSITVFAGTLLFSSFFSPPYKAGLVALAFWILVSLPGYFESTLFYSIFYHMKSPAYFLQGHSILIHLGLLLVVTFFFYELTVYFWDRREL